CSVGPSPVSDRSRVRQNAGGFSPTGGCPNSHEFGYAGPRSSLAAGGLPWYHVRRTVGGLFGVAPMSGVDIRKVQKLHTLGQGAHSTIFQVRRAEDSKTYALKVVSLEEADDQKFLAQAEHEFRVAQMLDHPGLVKVYALEHVKDWLFRVKKAHMLLEYVNGKTLDTCPPLKGPQLVQVFVKAAEALIHMHRTGVYHGDLKPNKIMLTRAGEVKLIDFGLARVKGEPCDRIQGTPEYMAPETAKHKMVNERTDIYNLGAAMYRMFTFRLPPPTI